MRIACVFMGRKGAGPIYAYEMVKALLEKGHDVVAFISSFTENLDSWKSLGIQLNILDTYTSTITYLKGTIKFRFKSLKIIKRKYAKSVFDSVYVPMDHPWNDMIISNLKYNKYLYTIHDPKEHSSNNKIRLFFFKLYSKFLKIGLKKNKVSDYIILSECFKKNVEKKYKTKNVHVIKHAIFDFYKKESSYDFYGYDKNKTNFLFFGRIDEYKGLHVLSKAYKEILKNNKDVTLTIVGSGNFNPYKNDYEKLDNVTIINRWIPDGEVFSYFDSSANVVVVLPYIDATQSGVIPIAMNAKVLCIVSNCGGLSEQVEQNVTGLMFKSGDYEELSKVMQNVVDNKYNKLIIDNAYNYINSLTWENSALKVIGIINNKLEDI